MSAAAEAAEAAPALAALALAAQALWAEEEDSTIGLYGCTKPITTAAIGGLRSSCPANRLPVLSSKAWPSGSISSLWALKKSTPNIGKATSAKRNFQEKILILESKLHQAVSPAMNKLTRRAKQLGSRGRQRRAVWKDAVGSTGVHKETLLDICSSMHCLKTALNFK
jgi:hypothetical protein